MSGARVLALFALFGSAGALAAIVLLLEPAGSSGSAEPRTLAALVRDPEALRGQTVTITGAVAERGYLGPADANAALVLTDDAGARVMVFVTGSAHPPRRPRPGTALRVTGRVTVAPPESARPTARADVSPSTLLMRTRAAAGIVATAIERADDAARATTPLRGFTRTTVRALLRHPRRHGNDLLALSGRVYRASRFGFVLVDDGHAVFVGASPDAMRSIRNSTRVRVRAEIGRMSRFRADTAVHAISSHRGGGRSVRSARIGRAPAKPGAPYLILREVRRARGGST